MYEYVHVYMHVCMYAAEHVYAKNEGGSASFEVGYVRMCACMHV